MGISGDNLGEAREPAERAAFLARQGADLQSEAEGPLSLGVLYMTELGDDAAAKRDCRQEWMIV